MNSRFWVCLFSERTDGSDLLPWDCNYALTAMEKNRIASSIQQFQLGEGSDGSGLLHGAGASALAAVGNDFLSSLELFIAEEQRHSHYLAKFMARQNIPCREQ